MENFFFQNREDMKICPKRGQKKFSRSARKGPFISGKYVMTWDGNVHQEPNQPFFSCFFYACLPSVQEEAAVITSKLFGEATVRNISKIVT